jgi:hypothetical protein
MELARQNVIILTAGLTGSSVVAGLLKGIGYWAGPETSKKPDYDTFENRDLVAMNERLLQEVGHRERFDRVFRRQQIDDVRLGAADIALQPYRQFIEACDRHAPWMWKDPRLWLTIRFWIRLLDRDRIRVILISREHSQAWISHILRRQIQSPRYCRDYMDGVRASLLEFIEQHRLPHLELVYEEILLQPERTLDRLGEFLGREIPIADLRRFYRGRLYCRRHGVADYLRAVLIYCRNFRRRSGTS